MKIFDVFCGEGIQGNPCAVIMLSGWPPEHELAQTARRLKVPVTSFIVSHGLEHHIRWFSAAGEINLCGHGSLAAGAALLEQSRQKRVTLSSRYGPVTIVKNANRYQLELPSWKRNNCSITKEQLGLTIEPLDIFSTRDLVVVLESMSAVKDYKPIFKKIRKLNQFHAVILTAMSSTNSYVLRYFAPNIGILEDIATGSAHCSIAPYWFDTLKQESLTALQLSKQGGLFELAKQDHSKIILTSLVKERGVYE